MPSGTCPKPDAGDLGQVGPSSSSGLQFVSQLPGLRLRPFFPSLQRRFIMNDDQIEQEIQAKGLTAPRITPLDIEVAIVGETYFTADEAAKATDQQCSAALCLLTLCILTLRNGFTIVGKSACVSPENFNAELGRKIAREDAVNQIWPLEGYRLRSELAARRLPAPV